ncbi:MAG TPA: 3-oxoacyl-[acyl-carrier-protein] reductase [Clostridia bacterium]|nr:3-oxoacyl-[acyl-carrier-protein] reductase [Clostridia bacterium]
MRLKDRVCLVTGASRGIGRAIALELAAAGADIAINFAGREDAAAETAQMVEELGSRAMVLKADVSDGKQVETMVKEVKKRFSKIDVLVNNAGITRDNLVMLLKEKEWDDVIDTNLKGAFNCIKSVSRLMLRARYGRIVNIASVVGLTGNAGQANYAAAKAGLVGLSKSVARELGSRGITVNVVAPGYILTDMTQNIAGEAKESMLAGIPLGRAGTPKDVADLVLFLASGRAAYITGQVLSVDGGMGMV